MVLLSGGEPNIIEYGHVNDAHLNHIKYDNTLYFLQCPKMYQEGICTWLTRWLILNNWHSVVSRNYKSELPDKYLERIYFLSENIRASPRHYKIHPF